MFRAWVLLLVAAVVVSTATAQEEKKLVLSLSGGLSFPSQPQDFSDYWNMGFNVGAGIGYSFSPSLSLGGSFDYSNFSFDADALLHKAGFAGYGISISGGSASIITVHANLKFSLIPQGASVSPYLLGGLGFFSLSASDVKVSYQGLNATVSPGSESAFSIHFGAGLDIPIAQTTDLFLQLAYGIGFTEDKSTNYLPVKSGVFFKL